MRTPAEVGIGLPIPLYLPFSFALPPPNRRPVLELVHVEAAQEAH